MCNFGDPQWHYEVIQRIQTLEILHGVLTCSMAEKETFQYKLKVMVIVQKDTKLKDSQCWYKITVYLKSLSKQVVQTQPQH